MSTSKEVINRNSYYSESLNRVGTSDQLVAQPIAKAISKVRAALHCDVRPGLTVQHKYDNPGTSRHKSKKNIVVA